MTSTARVAKRSTRRARTRWLASTTRTRIAYNTTRVKKACRRRRYRHPVGRADVGS
jgi:hypothetical protein